MVKARHHVIVVRILGAAEATCRQQLTCIIERTGGAMPPVPRVHDALRGGTSGENARADSCSMWDRLSAPSPGVRKWAGATVNTGPTSIYQARAVATAHATLANRTSSRHASISACETSRRPSSTRRFLSSSAIFTALACGTPIAVSCRHRRKRDRTYPRVAPPSAPSAHSRTFTCLCACESEFR